MMGFTPGPWVAEPPPAFDKGNPWRVTGPDTDTLAIVPYGYRNQIPATANARLIAAAPDLLTALQALCVAMREETCPDEAYRAALAVIAKATAQPPGTG